MQHVPAANNSNPFNDSNVPFTPKLATTPTALQVQSTDPFSRVPQSPRRIPVNAVTVPCGHCKELIPDGLVACPKCNGVLQSACDICNNMFSAFATTCPHCGTVYKTV